MTRPDPTATILSAPHRNGTSPLLVDIGASWVKIGYPGTRAPRFTHRTPRTADELSTLLRSVIRQHRNSSSEVQVSVAIAGIVAPDHTVRSLNLPINGTTVRDVLDLRAYERLITANDVHAMAASPIALGPDSSAFVIAAGTSVGGAYVERTDTNGRMRSMPAEVGHIPMSDVHGRCTCGGLSCVDLAIGGAHLIDSLGQEWWGRTQDLDVRDALEQAGKTLARTALTLSALFAPKRITTVGPIFDQPALWRSFHATMGTPIHPLTTHVHTEGWSLISTSRILTDPS